jgi:hypothetical protein
MKILLSFWLAFASLLVQPAYAQVAINEAKVFTGASVFKNFVKNPSGLKNALNITTSSAAKSRDTTSGNKIDGVASIICNTSANGGYCEFDLNTVDDDVTSGNCEFKGIYKGDASLYQFQIVDGSGNLLTGTTTLSSVTGWTPFSLNYQCAASGSRKVRVAQSVAGTSPDLNVGNMYYGKATNLGTVAQMKNNVLMTWSGTQTASHDTDNVFIASGGATFTELNSFSHSGGALTSLINGKCMVNWAARLQNFSDTAVERQRAAKILKNGVAVVQEGNLPGISGNNVNSGGLPTTVANENAQLWTGAGGVVDVATGDVLTFVLYQANGNGSARTMDRGRIDVSCMPSATQQTYSMDCGLTGSCINEFSATFSSSCVVSQENVDWINGNGANSTGICDFTFNTGFFTAAPNCTVMAQSNLTPFTNGAASTTTVQTRTYSGGTNTASAGVLRCSRQGTDLRPNVVAPVFSGSVTTGGTAPTSLMRVEWARISQSGGTYTLADKSDGVASITKNAAADISVNFSPAFAREMVCSAVPEGGCLVTSINTSHSASNFRFNMYTSNFGAACDTAMYVTCMGAR